MTRTIKTVGLLLFITAGQIAFGQNNKEKALEKALEAIKLMDDGKVPESIKLLEEAQKLDPDRFDYPYELAYAHYLKEDYKGAIKILEKNKSHKDVNERLFQLLGNCYDVLGNSNKAFEAYDEGLKIFPNSGMIYLEKGNVHWNKKEYGKALPFYEKGIEVDPKFPSNYYRATRVYCGSTEEVWGLIYGEIFMNLERNSKRTTEISKLLFDTYKSEIKFTSDTSMTISFCQQMTMNVNAISDPKNIKLPFCMIFEPTLLMSIAFEKSIDINSLDKIRSTFIDNYFNNERDKTYPNALFSYQKKVKDAGHIEAYNHWILMKGDEEGFDKWQSANKDKWDHFVKWFNDNGLKVDNSNKFYSGQY
ncbi:MAG TPA: tetratricopeptide repeat protein [Bacteroidia bacterium]|nr:tetratricopeptide repeat protein [Bacteroidia bacterium]HNU34377.1 tetratricopeptide repeat protein [Bacteroidia bacterium]